MRVEWDPTKAKSNLIKAERFKKHINSTFKERFQSKKL